MGKPFRPFQQLLGVLPVASAHALPPMYRALMIESASPLREYYPEDFKIDRSPLCPSSHLLCAGSNVERSEGTRNEWEGVGEGVRTPF